MQPLIARHVLKFITRFPMTKFTDVATSKLFVGVLAPTNAIENEILVLADRLESEIGTIDQYWPIEKGWIAPDSYMLETGEDLNTVIFVFNGLWHPQNLAYAKGKTMKIEDVFSGLDGSRKFNLNPGMIDNVSMRLASHKFAPRRYQISKDVWVEDQMRWIGNKLEPFPYVFQEYLMGKRYSFLKNLSEVTPTPTNIIQVGTKAVPGFTNCPIGYAENEC